MDQELELIVQHPFILAAAFSWQSWQPQQSGQGLWPHFYLELWYSAT